MLVEDTDVLRMPRPQAADICQKLGLASTSHQDYQKCVSEIKRVWLGEMYPDLIPRPNALANEDKTMEWESGLGVMYVDYPTEWALANFTSLADYRDCTVKFLILQRKKICQDAVEAKKTAEAA